jgi:hypothetical protein
MKTIFITFLLFLTIHWAFSQNEEKTSYAYYTYPNHIEKETTNIDSLLKFKDKIFRLSVYVYDKFSPKVYDFTNLDTLIIAYGNGKLPKGISKLKKLKYFELYWSRFNELPNDIQYLDNLIRIKILKDSENPNYKFIVPLYFAKMKSLKYLDFFETDVKFYNTTTVFKNIISFTMGLSANKKFPIPLSQFPNLNHLVITSSGNNYKWKIPKEQLLKMPSLRFVDIDTDSDYLRFKK